jgi:hypothetical protein
VLVGNFLAACIRRLYRHEHMIAFEWYSFIELLLTPEQTLIGQSCSIYVERSINRIFASIKIDFKVLTGEFHDC